MEGAATAKMGVTRHTVWGLIVGSLISAACLWYAFKGVNLSAVASAMGRVGVLWVVASVVVGLSSLVIRAIRWRLLLVAVRSVHMGPLTSATFIGMMANNLLPARLGEVVRAWVLARREQIPVPTVLASILVERLLDVLAALTILGLCLAGLPELGGGATGLLKRAGLAVLLAVAAAVVGLLLVLRFRERLLWACDRWSIQQGRAWLSRGLELFHRFLDGLCVFRSGAQVAVVAGLSLVVWAAAIACFQVLAEGFGLGLTPVQTALVFVIVLFGVAIPSAPGFVGTFHGFCVAGLGMVAGIDPTQAAAYATLLHGSQWVAINTVGIGCLLADRSLTWAGVISLARRG